DLYFPYPMKKRLFPVPEPMWPRRAEKQAGKRHIDVVIAADFREPYIHQMNIKQQLQQIRNEIPDARIGLMQVYHYNPDVPISIANDIRALMDGKHVQMLVFGEKIT